MGLSCKFSLKAIHCFKAKWQHSWKSQPSVNAKSNLCSCPEFEMDQNVTCWTLVTRTIGKSMVVSSKMALKMLVVPWTIRWFIIIFPCLKWPWIWISPILGQSHFTFLVIYPMNPNRTFFPWVILTPLIVKNKEPKAFCTWQCWVPRTHAPQGCPNWKCSMEKMPKVMLGYQQSGAPDIATLANITPITMVYDCYNCSAHGFIKQQPSLDHNIRRWPWFHHFKGDIICAGTCFSTSSLAGAAA